MRSYLTGTGGTRQTPQGKPIPGKSQVENSAGGYVFQLGALERLRRFTILGTASATYYVGQRQHTEQALAGVRAAFDELGAQAVEEIIEISKSGRAPRNDEAIYALAMAAGHSDSEVRRAALWHLSDVCRTGTHLFQFMEAVKHFRGHGVALNEAVRHWYIDKDPNELAYQLVKYRQRGGWTHTDVLRKVKPNDKGLSAEMDRLLGWAARGMTFPLGETVPGPLAGYLVAQAAETPTDTVAAIETYGGALPWECLKTEHLTDPKVIEALVPNMPLGALIRQLGRMSASEALQPMSALTQLVAERITNQEAIQKSRLHPIALLSALMTYQSGRGVRGGLTWTPTHEIVDALDSAFYMAFKNVEPTGKHHLLALDVSGSMTWGEIAGVPGLTPRVGAAAMAMAIAHSGDPYHVVAFSHEMVPVEISARERLDDVLRKTNSLSYGRTDCALPMLYALEKNLLVDCFVIYTDNETWYGNIHPVQALQQYRQRMGTNAKLVVVGMTATEFSIADPADSDALDVVGFDSATPGLIGDFVAGRL